MVEINIKVETNGGSALHQTTDHHIFVKRLVAQAWCARCGLKWEGAKAGRAARRHTRETGHETARLSGRLEIIRPYPKDLL